MTSITDGDGKIWSRGFNLEGIVSSTTDPLGNTSNFTQGVRVMFE